MPTSGTGSSCRPTRPGVLRIATKEGLSDWWTRDGVRGESAEGSTIEFYFGQPDPAAVMEVTRLDPGGQVVGLRRGCRRVGRHRAQLHAHRGGRRHRGAVHPRGLAGAERLHGPLQRTVGLLPAQPQEPRRDGQGHALAGGPEVLTPESPHRGRRLQGAGRSEPPAAARPPECPQRSEPAGTVRGPGHGPPVGQQAPRHPGGGQPGDHPAAGREKLHYLNAVPINEIAERWIHRYDRARIHALADLKHALEEAPMERPSSSTPRTSRRRPNACGRPSPTVVHQPMVAGHVRHRLGGGSTMTWTNHGVVIADPGQVILESDPPGGCPTRGTPSRRSWRSGSTSETSCSPGSPGSVDPA